MAATTRASGCAALTLRRVMNSTQKTYWLGNIISNYNLKGLILCFWDVKVYLICWNKYLFKNSIFSILVKLSNYSYTKYANLGSLYVLINNGPNGHLFYVGGDLIMRRGMLPIIILPDGDLRIVLHLVPFWILTIWGSVHINGDSEYVTYIVR